jgi:phosphate transport system permease protein
MNRKHSLSLRYWHRKLTNQVGLGLIWLVAIAACIPFLSVTYYVVSRGAPALNWAFFTKLPAPVGEGGGGMANAIVGSFKLVALGGLIGIPWGIFAGVYLAEFGVGKTASILRFSNDVLASVPSIIVGLFVYAVLVMPFGGFSTYAGAVALGIIMIPVVARTTEEILKLLPNHMREAGLALGLPRWKVIVRIVIPGSAGGIVTGVMLAIARVAGETAPLLFTSFNNQFWSKSLDQPVASLPVQIYTYAISPFAEWQAQAWAGAFILLVFIFFINILTRAVLVRGGSR